MIVSCYRNKIILQYFDTLSAIVSFDSGHLDVSFMDDSKLFKLRMISTIWFNRDIIFCFKNEFMIIFCSFSDIYSWYFIFLRDLFQFECWKYFPWYIYTVILRLYLKLIISRLEMKICFQIKKKIKLIIFSSYHFRSVQMIFLFSNLMNCKIWRIFDFSWVFFSIEQKNWTLLWSIVFFFSMFKKYESFWIVIMMKD